MATKGRERAGQRSGGRVVITLPALGIGIFISLVAIGLILLYVIYAPARDDLKFAVGALATAGGIAAAYYIGSGLRASAQSERMARSFSFPARFGDPAWAPSRQAVGQVLKTCQSKPEAERLKIVEDAINNDPNLESHLLAVLNFLEELALALNLGLADEVVLDRFYRTTVLRTFGALAPWVKTRRDQRGSQRIWQELGTVYALWEAK